MVAQPPSSYQVAPALTPEEERKIRFLKGVCIALGALIFAALAAMLVGFLSGGKKSDDAARLGAGQGQANIAVIPQPTAPAASLMPMLAEFDLELASGQEVRQVEIEGNRLVLVTGAAGGQGPASGEVIIVDLASGKVASRIGLKPASGASAGE